MTLKIRSLRKEFDVAGGKEVAVDDINLEIGESEFVTLVGPSGCGKTTTLRCMAGLETPTSGEILINGEDVTDIPPSKRDLSMMFQDISLYPHMKIIDNIAYPLKVRNVPKNERYEEARDAAEVMQIEDLLEKYPGELSGGQRQRSALARTLVYDPVAFLLDEPLSDLDAKLKVEIRKEIQKVHRRVKRPTLYVTHDQTEAMTMSDRIAVMNDGNIEQVGTPNELYTNPINIFVARFIGSPSINTFKGNLLSTTDGISTIEIANTKFEFNIDYREKVEKGSEIIVGIRPENIKLSPRDQHGLIGEVLLVERIGDRILVTIDGPEEEEIRAVTPSNILLEENEEVSINFDEKEVYIFHPKTGETLGIVENKDKEILSM